MQHKLNIKFGEVTNLASARYAASVGATMMGFNLSPQHPNYISPENLKEICNWAPGPSLVSEWESEDIDEIIGTCNRLDLDYVQLNSFDPARTEALKHDFCVIQNIGLHAADNTADIIQKINAVNGLVMYYMLSFKTLADQEAFLAKSGNALLVTDLCRNQPVLLNFHFNAANIAALVEEFAPFGINLNDGGETTSGHQDFSALNEMLEQIGAV